MTRNIMITLLLISSSLPALSAGLDSAPIDHFVLSPTPHIVPMTIPGFQDSTVAAVYDAGKYAFANDGRGDSAYFDGTSWSLVKKGTYTCEISPDYPTTGKQGGAWFWCDDGIQHFNPSTKTFSNPIDVNKQLGVSSDTQMQVYIATSGGFLFLIGQVQDSNIINFAIYNENTQQWSSPVKMKGLDSRFSIDDVVANDDSNPRVLVNMSEEELNSPVHVVEINKDARYYLVPQLQDNTYQLHPHAPLIMDGKASYGIIQDLYDQSYALLYSNGLSSVDWTTIQLPDATNYGDFYFERKDLFKGNLCKLLINENNLFVISCIDIFSENPTWSPLITLSNTPFNTVPYFEARHDGAWIGYNLDSSPVIVDYSATTKTVVNTHIGKHVTFPEKVEPRGIGPHELLACVEDGNTPIQLYIYDNSLGNKKWHKLNATDSGLTSCNMSQLGGNSYHNFWLFNDIDQQHKNRKFQQTKINNI